jgi:hypothetical protein
MLERKIWPKLQAVLDTKWARQVVTSHKMGVSPPVALVSFSRKRKL